VAAALGPHRAVLLCNHGVLVTGKDVAWATLSAATLERAARLQSIASTLGTLRPIPADAALAMHADKYRDAFVEEYWAAWLRKLGEADARMRA
jgi:L-fuculose-phosphate aldolase